MSTADDIAGIRECQLFYSATMGYICNEGTDAIRDRDMQQRANDLLHSLTNLSLMARKQHDAHTWSFMFYR